MSSGPDALPSGGASPTDGGRAAAADAGGRAERAPAGDGEGALRESEARYHGFFEESFDGMFITTRDGRFLDVNRRSLAIFGYGTKEEMLALDVGRDVYVDPEDRRRILRRLDVEGRGEFDVAAKRKGGERLLARFAISAERDGAGVIRSYRTIVRDVTELRRAEEALARQSAILRSIMEGGDAIMAAFDREGRYIAFNAAYVSAAQALWGFQPEVGQRLLDLVPPGRDRDFGERCLARGLAGERYVEEGVLGEESARRRCLRVSVSPIVGDGGEVIGLVGLAQDLTERRNLEEQLRQSQKLEAVARLAGGVAHDFNNILAVINGCADLALEAIPASDPAREDLVEIREAGQRAASLTRQLLAFARKQVLQPVVLGLNDVVAEAEKMLRRLVGEDVALHTRLASDLGGTVADRSEMEQVIANLAVNARDAMPRGGRLTLETSNVELDEEWARTHPEVRPGPYVCLAVSDTGCGMDAETLARAFDPFFTTKEPGKGSGLGLPTVHGIVRQSGGSVAIASEPGRGTTVRVFLPRRAEPGEAPLGPPRSVAELRGHETVLVVEDQPQLRGVIERVLRGLGYRVLAAGSGEGALAVSRTEPGAIDLLLTDVVMPGLGGPSVVQQLAGTRPRMKVLYMSGYSDDAVVKHGILAREARFLAKPFGASALALAVRKALDEGGPAAAP